MVAFGQFGCLGSFPAVPGSCCSPAPQPQHHTELGTGTAELSAKLPQLLRCTLTLPLTHSSPKCQKSQGAFKKKTPLKNNGLGFLLWQIHEVNGWFPQVIMLLMEQSKNPSADTTGANDLRFNNVDAPKAPCAIFLLFFFFFLGGRRGWERSAFYFEFLISRYILYYSLIHK